MSQIDVTQIKARLSELRANTKSHDALEVASLLTALVGAIEGQAEDKRAMRKARREKRIAAGHARDTRLAELEALFAKQNKGK